jgi:hypothetical protein
MLVKRGLLFRRKNVFYISWQTALGKNKKKIKSRHLEELESDGKKI